MTPIFNTHEKNLTALCADLRFLSDKVVGNEYVSTIAFSAMMAANAVDALRSKNETLRNFVEEVRRTGDTRLASMAIGVLAKVSYGETAPYEWDDVDTYGASSC